MQNLFSKEEIKHGGKWVGGGEEVGEENQIRIYSHEEKFSVNVGPFTRTP